MMKWPFQLLLVSTLATLVCTEVVDYGELKNYEPKGDAPDGIQPDAIWVGTTEEGFNIILGTELKSKIAGILDACENKDDKCFQDLSKALEDAHLQQDHRLQSRQLLIAAALIADAFQAGVAAIQGALAGAALVMGAAWFTGDRGNKGTFWSSQDASNAAQMPEGTPVTLSADGSAVATVTKHPATTALEGKVTPSVTVVTETTDGFERGDLAAILDSDLADRLDEFMQRSKQCEVGIEFDKAHPATRKRQSSGTYGQAICAAQSAMGGATRGGAFNDLLFLAPTGTHFNFVEAAGPALAAANQMAEFVTEWSPLVSMPEEALQQIGLYVLALAIDTVVENLPLSGKNVIKASSVTASSADEPTSTSSACPKRTEIICGYPKVEHCRLKFKEVDGKMRSVCEDTDLKDCECITQGRQYVNIWTTERQQDVLFAHELLSGEVKGGGDGPQCKKDKMTVVPSELFSSDKMNIHEHFCEGWNSGKEHKMKVDAKGNSMDPEPQLERRFGKRTPPASTSGYENVEFNLSYKPKEGGGECKQECNAAFRSFAESCTATSPGRYIYESGTYDVGCGTFEFKIKIEEPVEKTELKVFEQKCHQKESVNIGGTDGDVTSPEYYSRYPCKQGVIKKGDESTFVKYLNTQSFQSWPNPKQYNIWWKEGCSLENGATEMNIATPLGGELTSPTSFCGEIMEHNWADCDNAGRGGAIQVGCLMYEFVPTMVMRTTWGDM